MTREKNLEILRNINIPYVENPWQKDSEFEIHGLDTLEESPNIHLLDDVVTFFDNNINISFNKKNFLIGVFSSFIRINDPYLEFEKIFFNNHEMGKTEDLEVYINNFSKFMLEENVITILVDPVNLDYSKVVLIYKVTSE